MFKISRRLDYGIQLMVALAHENGNQPKPTAKLSQSLNIPLPFLHQIGHTLMQSGLIKAMPGPRGGLKLNISPEKISILQIAEVLEGPICLNDCLNATEECSHNETCSAKVMWGSLQSRILDYLGNVNLDDLSKSMTSNN
ncbi:MAG: hypothetical protein BGO78_15630 [Chloroflexi bacterium 44-23]|nr:MAG: hypothetical protein BGO78_15630 [Chloroflexi bacterium 44-23]